MPEEQLAKQGTYRAFYGWSISSTLHQLEAEHVYGHDVYKGTICNDAGEGFLHESSCVCFGVRDLTGAKGVANGYGVMTDKDNEQAFFHWQGTIDPAEGFNGDYQWTGGTGKYAGIQGNNTFRAISIGSTSEGRGLLQGAWHLP